MNSKCHIYRAESVSQTPKLNNTCKEKNDENLKKSIVTFVVSMFVMMAFVILEKSMDAMAASEPEFYGTNYQFMRSPEWDSFGLNIGNLSDKAKVKVSVNI